MVNELNENSFPLGHATTTVKIIVIIIIIIVIIFSHCLRYSHSECPV